MDEKIYYNAEEISRMLSVSMGKSYKILREMNRDLAGRGFLTIAGKIPLEYFREKWYGAAKEAVV
jgi:sugar-specific transcriptional regulator TrmB